MDPPAKAAKKHFRKLAELVHERELGKVLDDLQIHFERWKKGEIDALVLNEKIRAHSVGASQELYNFYVYADPVFVVARALKEGILKKKEVDDAYFPLLKPLMDT